jgi:hypothetical protein
VVTAGRDGLPDLPRAPGAEPFWCELVVDLTEAQFNALIDEGLTLRRQHAPIAPLVLTWNYVGVEIGEDGSQRTALLPPSAEAGPAAFDAVDRETVVWIADRILLTRVEDPDRPNSSPPANRGAGGTGGTSKAAED